MRIFRLGLLSALVLAGLPCEGFLRAGPLVASQQALLAERSHGNRDAPKPERQEGEAYPLVEVEVVDEEQYESYQRARRKADSDAAARSDSDTNSGAGVAGAVLGGVLGGPIGALGLGLAATWVAEHGEGRLGETVRKTGSATHRVLDRAQSVNEKYNVTKSVEKGAKLGFDWVRKSVQGLNRDY